MISVVFIINGDRESPMGYRARALATHLRERYQLKLDYRTGNKIIALLRFLRSLIRVRPQVTYVFDMSYSGVLAAWLHRLLFRNHLIIETGDSIYELMRSTGNRGRLGLLLTRWLEGFSLRVADRVVVRGRYHQQWLEQIGVMADVVQDGVDTEQFKPIDAEELRQRHGLGGTLTVGLVGSSIWSDKLGMCYGWELIELLRLLPAASVTGVIIGDGSGIAHLKARCREYGIEDRVIFLGHIPFPKLPRYLNMIDVCLSTQTNDLVGKVRTSGKLPLYLATGRYVLATDVGEAALRIGSIRKSL
jgi:glycosyltransferase involved in cell wall biosynthesis